MLIKMLMLNNVKEMLGVMLVLALTLCVIRA